MQTFYFLVCCFFFRDPIRNIASLDKDKFLSPADGKVLYVKDFKDPELLTTPNAKNPNDKQKIAELIFNSHLYGMKPPKETRELVV